jgi:anti-anti-sigma factor
MTSSTSSNAVGERLTGFRPEGELTIYTIAEQHRQLTNLLDAEPVVQVDLSAVNEVDTAGLQLLILAKREAARRGIALLVAGCSDVVEDALATVGLGGLLDGCAAVGTSH